MIRKVVLELDEPYEQYFLTVAEFAFEASRRGLPWDEVRAKLLAAGIPKAFQYKAEDIFS